MGRGSPPGPARSCIPGLYGWLQHGAEPGYKQTQQLRTSGMRPLVMRDWVHLLNASNLSVLEAKALVGKTALSWASAAWGLKGCLDATGEERAGLHRGVGTWALADTLLWLIRQREEVTGISPVEARRLSGLFQALEAVILPATVHARRQAIEDRLSCGQPLFLEFGWSGRLSGHCATALIHPQGYLVLNDRGSDQPAARYFRFEASDESFDRLITFLCTERNSDAEYQAAVADDSIRRLGAEPCGVVFSKAQNNPNCGLASPKTTVWAYLTLETALEASETMETRPQLALSRAAKSTKALHRRVTSALRYRTFRFVLDCMGTRFNGRCLVDLPGAQTVLQLIDEKIRDHEAGTPLSEPMQSKIRSRLERFSPGVATFCVTAEDLGHLEEGHAGVMMISENSWSLVQKDGDEVFATPLTSKTLREVEQELGDRWPEIPLIRRSHLLACAATETEDS